MNKYTVTTSYGEAAHHAISDGARIIADVRAMGEIGSAWRAESAADARRIAAALNACEGIPTTDLENAQAKAHETLTDKLGKVCRDRDALRAAVLAVLPDLKHYAATHGTGPDLRLAALREVLEAK